jgi:hypothetical protein
MSMEPVVATGMGAGVGGNVGTTTANSGFWDCAKRSFQPPATGVRATPIEYPAAASALVLSRISMSSAPLGARLVNGAWLPTVRTPRSKPQDVLALRTTTIMDRLVLVCGPCALHCTRIGPAHVDTLRRRDSVGGTLTTSTWGTHGSHSPSMWASVARFRRSARSSQRGESPKVTRFEIWERPTPSGAT